LIEKEKLIPYLDLDLVLSGFLNVVELNKKKTHSLEKE